MKLRPAIVVIALALSGCALFQTEREVSKAEGFAALVSYGRTAALLAQAKID